MIYTPTLSNEYFIDNPFKVGTLQKCEVWKFWYVTPCIKPNFSIVVLYSDCKLAKISESWELKCAILNRVLLV